MSLNHPWQDMPLDTVKQSLVQCVKDLRNVINAEIRMMQRAQLETNMEKKLARLASGKKGIQAAMGKGLSDARMVALTTQHSNVVVAQLQHHSAADVKAICLRVDSDCCFEDSTDPDHLCCIPSLLQAVFSMLERLGEEGVATSLQLRPAVVDKPLDILASLENFMGSEGKARGMVCPTCRSPKLTCLARVTGEGLSLGWYCTTCNQCCEYVEDTHAYDNVPWSEECVKEQRRVPEQSTLSPDFRLRTPLEWEDFQHLLYRLPNRKAPGDNQVPGELWKQAPDWAQRILFDTLNSILQGSPMPNHWRGGTKETSRQNPAGTGGGCSQET